eukprot:TCONS_00072616-protein
MAEPLKSFKKDDRHHLIQSKKTKNTRMSAPTRSQRLAAKRAMKASQLANQENVGVPSANLKKVKGRSGKRSVSEMSPAKAPVTRKRTAFGDITNAIHAHAERISMGKKKAPVGPSKKTTRPMTRNSSQTKIDLKKPVVGGNAIVRNRFGKLKEDEVAIHEAVLSSDLISSSNENQNEAMTSFSSETMSMLEGSFNDSLTASGKRKPRPVPRIPMEILKDSPVPETSAADTTLPDGVKPYDLDEDPNSVSEYADSIFRNMKKRELKFAVQNYLIQEGSETTGAMRAILVDWLVEVQENFELYHETLYLAVKITDFYLQHNPTPKELLQLVGATALLLSCKIEERSPPPLDDFQFICDDAYTHKQFVDMELKVLTAIDFELNIPVPYRFLRRFARVTGMSMQILTLSRYLLELSLHESKFVAERPSKVAAACLCLSLKLKKEHSWNVNFSYHTGYEERELEKLVRDLNKMMTDAPKNKLQTVRTKYSHTIFYEVAKTEPLPASELQ